MVRVRGHLTDSWSGIWAGSSEEVGLGFSLALKSGWGKNEYSRQRAQLGPNHGTDGKDVGLELIMRTGGAMGDLAEGGIGGAPGAWPKSGVIL